LFSINKRHKMISDAMLKNGIKNVDDYLERPENVEPPKPDPFKMKELEIQDKTAQAALLNAQTNMEKVKADTQVAMLKQEIEKLKAAQTQWKNEHDAVRQDADVANRIDVAQREMELAESVPVSQEGQRTIVSPNS
jgi:uncharacterized small protein (DUF1192 family)